MGSLHNVDDDEQFLWTNQQNVTLDSIDYVVNIITSSKIQDGGQPLFAIPKNRHISVNNQTILIKFGKLTQIKTLKRNLRLN